MKKVVSSVWSLTGTLHDFPHFCLLFIGALVSDACLACAVIRPIGIVAGLSLALDPSSWLRRNFLLIGTLGHPLRNIVPLLSVNIALLV
jgi:hypothetical protein